jgi:hypothetical protein
MNAAASVVMHGGPNLKDPFDDLLRDPPLLHAALGVITELDVFHAGCLRLGVADGSSLGRGGAGAPDRDISKVFEISQKDYWRNYNELRVATEREESTAIIRS